MDAQRKSDGRFLPGHTISKGIGRPPLPRHVQNFSVELRDCIIQTLAATPADCEQTTLNPEASILEVTVAQFALDASKGSIQHLETLLSRAIGRTKEAPAISEQDQADVIEMIPKETAIQLLTAYYDKQRSSAT